ncbi:MAG TPA: hypothetical protein VFZ53_34605 [Polyangiaceae bacterium]
MDAKARRSPQRGMPSGWNARCTAADVQSTHRGMLRPELGNAELAELTESLKSP